MRSTVITIATIIVGLGALSGCAGKDSSSASSSSSSHASASDNSSATEYCAAVENMGDLSAQSSSNDLVAKSRKIAEIAPADIKADWETFADAQEASMAALNTKLDTSDPSKSLAEMQSKMGSLEENSTRMMTAAQNIGTHIETTCGK